MSLPFIVFFACALLAVAGGITLILAREPIHSALALILVMVTLAVIYVLLGAEFVAAVQIIVYAGAIMVLFVFVIMLLNAGEEERTTGSRAAYIVGFPGAAAIFCLLSFVFLSERHALGGTNIGGYLNHVTSNISEISSILFTKLLLPFEVTSILILVAILGAVVLARKEQ